MLIDNLKDINSQADLFNYICTIEEELDRKGKQVSQYLNELSKIHTMVLLMVEECGFKDARFSAPKHGHHIRAYITNTDNDNDVVGEFVDGYYYEKEGYRLAGKYSDKVVRYWKDIETPGDCNCEREE